MTRRILLSLFVAVSLAAVSSAAAQEPQDAARDKQKVRTVSIPISIFSREELRRGKFEEFVQAEQLLVNEDKEPQTILSIRTVTDAPLALAVLIQEDLTSSFNLQIKDIKNFIRALPRGSRVMVGYIRGGNLQIEQRFTDDLARAADSLRIVVSGQAYAGRNPYDGVVDALNRFDALPAGRRAVLLFSDGADLSLGPELVPSSQSADLDRAIHRAQRRSAAVFSIYSPASSTDHGSSQLILASQGMLQKLSDETGGRAFFQGTIAPISFDPFFKDLKILLNRQFLLTYLSTHMKRGYHRVEVTSTNPGVKIEHPKGYYYR